VGPKHLPTAHQERTILKYLQLLVKTHSQLPYRKIQAQVFRNTYSDFSS